MNNQIPTQATTALPSGYSDRLRSAACHPDPWVRIELIDSITDELARKGVCRPRTSLEILPRSPCA